MPRSTRCSRSVARRSISASPTRISLTATLIAGFDLFRTVTDSYTAAGVEPTAIRKAISAATFGSATASTTMSARSFTYTSSQRDIYDIADRLLYLHRRTKAVIVAEPAQPDADLRLSR